VRVCVCAAKSVCLAIWRKVVEVSCLLSHWVICLLLLLLLLGPSCCCSECCCALLCDWQRCAGCGVGDDLSY
jgi:hypothetical protein